MGSVEVIPGLANDGFDPACTRFCRGELHINLDATCRAFVTLPPCPNRIKLSVGGQMRQPFCFAGINQYKQGKCRECLLPQELHLAGFPFRFCRKVKPHWLKLPPLEHPRKVRIIVRGDPAAAAVLACVPGDASAPRLLPRRRRLQTIQFVSGRRTIPLRRGGGAGP